MGFGVGAFYQISLLRKVISSHLANFLSRSRGMKDLAALESTSCPIWGYYNNIIFGYNT